MKKNNQNVVFMSYDGLTDPLGQAQILPYLIGLRKKGYEIAIISHEKIERYQENKEHIEKLCKDNELEWHPLFYTKKPPILSTLKDIRAMKNKLKSLHKSKKIDLIHARSYITALIALQFKRKLGIKFLFDMRGFWADERVEGGIWNLKNPLYKTVYNFFKRKERKFLKEADHIVSLTEAGKKEIIQLIPNINSKKITVIPCCVDTQLFNPENIKSDQVKTLKSALKLEKTDKVIGYVGSIGTWYMLDEMLLFFKKQYEKDADFKFLFVTNESYATILSAAKKIGLTKSAIRYASTSYRYVPLHIKLMDWGIFFIRPTFSKKASSPTKQGELMAMGVPVICNAGVGDTDFIVEKFNAGVVAKDDLETIELNAKTFQSDRIREGAVEYFGLENGIERYARIYASS